MYITLIVTAFLVAIATMLVTWVVAERIKNASIVDIVWAGGFCLLSVICVCLSQTFSVRSIFFTVMVSSWSLRLAWHLYKRIRAHYPAEDARYEEFRRQWGRSASFNFFWFFQMQAIILFALSAPSGVVSLNEDDGFGVYELAASIIFLIALIGETQADNQLKRFKKNPKNKNEVCAIGLWKYSRHPNYFFEWLIWCAFFVYALGSPYGIFTAYCPLLMLFFLLKVSGVPLAEQQSLKSKGDKYRRYQQSTSVFFPWFKKAGSQ